MRLEPLPSILVSQVQEVTGRFLELVQPLSLVQLRLLLLPAPDGMRLVKTGPLLPLLEPPPNGVLLMPPRVLSGKCHQPLIDNGIAESKGKIICEFAWIWGSVARRSLVLICAL